MHELPKMANDESITRSTAAMRLAVEDGLDGAIILIGNAPTAAFELARAVETGKAKPALIVATEVGYVGAAESKEVIAKLPIPFITVKGRKGGSTIAVAIFNALLSMAEGKARLTGHLYGEVFEVWHNNRRIRGSSIKSRLDSLA